MIESKNEYLFEMNQSKEKKKTKEKNLTQVKVNLLNEEKTLTFKNNPKVKNINFFLKEEETWIAFNLDNSLSYLSKNLDNLFPKFLKTIKEKGDKICRGYRRFKIPEVLNEVSHVLSITNSEEYMMKFSWRKKYLAVIKYIDNNENDEMYKLEIFETTKWQLVFEKTINENVHSMNFNKEENYFIYLIDEEITFLEIQTQKITTYPIDLDYERFSNLTVMNKNEKILLSSLFNDYISVYKLNSEKTEFEFISTIPTSFIVYQLKISYDEKKFAVILANNSLKIYDAESGNLKRMLEEPNNYTCCQFSYNDKSIITGGNDRKVKFFDVETGYLIKILEGHSNNVISIDLSINGNRIFTVDSDKNIKIWETETMVLLRSLKSEEEIVSIHSFDKSFITTNFYEEDSKVEINLWKNLKFENKTIVYDKNYEFEKICLSEDESFYILCGLANRMEGKKFTKIYKTQKNIFVEDISENLNFGTLINFILDRYVYFIDENKIKMFDLFTRDEPIEIFEKENPFKNLNLKFIYDQEKVFFVVHKTELHVCHYLTGDTIKIINKKKPILDFLVYGDFILISGQNGHVYFHEGNKKVKEIHANNAGVFKIMMTPDGEKLLTFGGDDLLKIWDFKSGYFIFQMKLGNKEFIKKAKITSDSKKLIYLDYFTKSVIILQIEIGDLLNKISNENFERIEDMELTKDDNIIFCVGSKKMNDSSDELTEGMLINWEEGMIQDEYPDYVSFSNCRSLIQWISKHSIHVIEDHAISSSSKSKKELVKFMPKPSMSFWYLSSKTEIIAHYIASGYANALPFNMTLLHYYGYSNDTLSLEKILAILEKKSIHIPLVEDYFGNNFLDILLKQKNTTILARFIPYYSYTYSELSSNQKITFKLKYKEKPLTYYLIDLLENDIEGVDELMDSRLIIPPESLFKSQVERPNYSDIFDGIITNSNNDLFVPNTFFQKLSKRNENQFLKGKKKGKIVFKMLDLKGIMDPNISFLQKILDTLPSNHPIFGSSALEAILTHKWQTKVKKAFLIDAILFVVFTVLFITNSVFLFPEFVVQESVALKNNIYAKSSIPIIIVLLLYLSYFLIEEIKQVRKIGFYNYFRSIWNYVDLIFIILSVPTLIINLIASINSKLFSDVDFLRPFHSISLFFVFIRLLSFLRIFDELSFLVRMILQVFIDMKNFLLIIITLGSAFYFSCNL